MKIQLSHTYKDIISLENIACAWQEFIIGKSSKVDVQIFERNLMDNILALHQDLVQQTYQHGGYESFYVNDPKRRHIHKASVRDRLLHHALYRQLYPFFDRTFIADSFSCRNEKGTHKAMERFKRFSDSVSKNHTRSCYVLKCDIKKFFASIDHEILINILKEYIPDKKILGLFENIIGSFCTTPEKRVGLPLGNLTSQLLGNVYMNIFDQWVKHTLKVKQYIRYADDFVFFSMKRSYLEGIIPEIENFLMHELHLTLHPHKLFIKTVASGVDFLGWVHFPDHKVLRTVTKKRMFMKIKGTPDDPVIQSYLGLLKYGNTIQLQEQVLNQFWLFH